MQYLKSVQMNRVLHNLLRVLIMFDLKMVEMGCPDVRGAKDSLLSVSISPRGDCGQLVISHHILVSGWRDEKDFLLVVDSIFKSC